MDQKQFDEYPVIGTVAQFIDLLASIAARMVNETGEENNDARKSDSI